MASHGAPGLNGIVARLARYGAPIPFTAQMRVPVAIEPVDGRKGIDGFEDGRNYWYAQWREDGKPRSKELGLCSKVSRAEAEAKIAEIFYPQDSKAGQLVTPIDTLGELLEVVYLPVYRRRWKPSAAVTEENQPRVNLVPELGPILIEAVTRGALHSAALPTGDSARPIPE